MEGATAGENLVKSKTTATATLRMGSQNIVDLTAQHFIDGVCELPRINYAFNGKNYNYFYGIGEKERNGIFDLGMDVVSLTWHDMTIDCIKLFFIETNGCIL